MSVFRLDARDFERLGEAMLQYQGNVEEAINDVLHNQGGQLIHDEIIRLMPRSDRQKKHAKDSNPLLIDGGNLSVTVRTKNKFHYLYFPDDGQNVRNQNRQKAGNQQFFMRGGENKKEEILNRCIGRLTEAFEESI
jgi:hypothetical protein